MASEAAADIPDDLDQLRRHFEEFRNTYPGHSRERDQSFDSACYTPVRRRLSGMRRGENIPQKEPATLVRIMGARATEYDDIRAGAAAVQRLRTNLHRGYTRLRRS